MVRVVNPVQRRRRWESGKYRKQRFVIVTMATLHVIYRVERTMVPAAAPAGQVAWSEGEGQSSATTVTGLGTILGELYEQWLRKGLWSRMQVIVSLLPPDAVCTLLAGSPGGVMSIGKYPVDFHWDSNNRQRLADPPTWLEIDCHGFRVRQQRQGSGGHNG